jgi:hypothetical protein
MVEGPLRQGRRAPSNQQYSLLTSTHQHNVECSEPRTNARMLDKVPIFSIPHTKTGTNLLPPHSSSANSSSPSVSPPPS